MRLRVGDWLDQRTGHRALMRQALDEPVLGGARWAYVFGSALAFLVMLQIATGCLLALYYSPSTREAWGSVNYVTHTVRLGWFVRGLHHWGSSAMIVLLVAHLFQVFLYGAYRPPREVGWWSGVALLAVTLGFSLTGYLLPWDQKGYWASRVVTSIVGSFPYVGTSLKGVMQGGNDFGNITLTRFFGFHAFVLPASLALVLGVHIVAFRKHGVTPAAKRTAAELEASTQPFWPRQVTYDAVFSAVVVAGIVAMTLLRHGAPLDAPADPASNYPARPEWYFLWLFELLKSLPGGWEGAGVLAFSIFSIAFLAALPVVDRSRSALLRDRWPFVAVAFLLATTVAVLTIRPMIADARDPSIQAQEQEAAASARHAFALAELGIPPGGANELYLNDPLERGKHGFAVQCQSCHAADGKGGDSAPDLTGYLSRGWAHAIVAQPTRSDLYGRLKMSGMDPPDATPAEMDTLTDFVLSLGSATPRPPGGAELFDEKGCHTCHALAGDPPRSGPSLDGFASKAWIVGLINDPGGSAYFGEHNEMPAFRGRITEAQIGDILMYLSSLAPRDRSRP
jgi:ubiquinol-cytochrome c reductase cytochrome b subunit